jgi:hypothetical protein
VQIWLVQGALRGAQLPAESHATGCGPQHETWPALQSTHGDSWPSGKHDTVPGLQPGMPALQARG